jgi:hypothetical protein
MRLGASPGLTAQLTILKYNPAKDIGALAAIQYTIRDGRTIYDASR